MGSGDESSMFCQSLLHLPGLLYVFAPHTCPTPTTTKHRCSFKTRTWTSTLGLVHSQLREDINSKKTFSFGHCPNHLNRPPLALTPIRATWSSFFTSKTTFCAYDRKNLILIMKVAMIIMMIIMTKMTKKTYIYCEA